jgi:hypothetical protein
MASIFTPEFWRGPAEYPVLIAYLLVAVAVGYGIHLLYRGEQDLISEVRQPLLMRAPAAGASFFKVTSEVLFNRRWQRRTF